MGREDQIPSHRTAKRIPQTSASTLSLGGTAQLQEETSGFGELRGSNPWLQKSQEKAQNGCHDSGQTGQNQLQCLWRDCSLSLKRAVRDRWVERIKSQARVQPRVRPKWLPCLRSSRRDQLYCLWAGWLTSKQKSPLGMMEGRIKYPDRRRFLEGRWLERIKSLTSKQPTVFPKWLPCLRSNSRDQLHLSVVELLTSEKKSTQGTMADDHILGLRTAGESP